MQKQLRRYLRQREGLADNPLIAHIADKKDVYRLAKEVPKDAELLMKEFLPVL